VNENYPGTGKHIFFKNNVHGVLHYDGGDTVKIVCSLRHDTPLFMPQTMCRRLISEFEENLCGSQSGNSTSSVSAMSFSSGSDR
jgi:cytidine deaminase